MRNLISTTTVEAFISTVDFHSSLNLAATVICRTLMLLGIRKRTLPVVIIKSRTSGLSGVAAESWLAYCINSWKPKLIQALLPTHLQTNWPKYWATSVGAEMDSVCVSLCKSVWQGQCHNNNISHSSAAVKDLSMSLALKRAKQTFYIGAFQLNRKIHSKYPAEKLKLRGAVRRHHEWAQTCLCVPCDAVAAQRLTGCIRESPSEGWLT